MAIAPTCGSAQGTTEPTERNFDWTATPHCSASRSTATIEYVETIGRGGFGEIWAEPPGRAARPEAGSSVAPVVVTTGAPCVRGLGTSIAPRRRAISRQTLLAIRLLDQVDLQELRGRARARRLLPGERARRAPSPRCPRARRRECLPRAPARSFASSSSSSTSGSAGNSISPSTASWGTRCFVAPNQRSLKLPPFLRAPARGSRLPVPARAAPRASRGGAETSRSDTGRNG